MTDFSAFSKDEAGFLAGLPYKVGIWISYAEDTDGDRDDDREERILLSCLRRFAKLQEEKSLIGSMMSESLRRKEAWGEWADSSHTILADIKKALALLREKGASAEEIKALKRTLMEIGKAVAQATGEFSAFDDGDEEGFFGKIVRAVTGFAADDVGHPMNVSAAEDSALEKLRQTLREKL